MARIIAAPPIEARGIDPGDQVVRFGSIGSTDIWPLPGRAGAR
jgi:hypothetical protein